MQGCNVRLSLFFSLREKADSVSAGVVYSFFFVGCTLRYGDRKKKEAKDKERETEKEGGSEASSLSGHLPWQQVTDNAERVLASVSCLSFMGPVVVKLSEPEATGPIIAALHTLHSSAIQITS